MNTLTLIFLSIVLTLFAIIDLWHLKELRKEIMKSNEILNLIYIIVAKK